MPIYVRFNNIYKHCQYCKKSEKLDFVNTPKGLSWVHWCNRNQCVVTAICYCDDADGFEYDISKFRPETPHLNVGNEGGTEK